MDARRRFIVVGATIAMFVAILAMSRVTGTQSMSLLYAGLDSAAAGDVVAALEQQGVPYEIRGNAIHVDSGMRDSLRMTLASEGLPANSGAGYELLDGLSGFGTTSQMFDAAYWRAKEGELARTILASPQIKSARVHIAQSPSQPFQRNSVPTASVTVGTAAGSLAPAQANALRHLVAAAVTGMKPDDVAVIDTVGGLIPAEADLAMPGGSADARAKEMRENIERLLAARVGPGKAVVEVAVDVVTERESVTERRFDPQGRVAISSDTETKKGTDSQGGGAVTVASNLPDGAAGSGGDTASSENEETRERVNYEVSETSREILRLPGAIRKISVAVLVDGVSVTAADGTVSQEARTDDELEALRELVASAVGLDEARGDVLTLKSLSFEPAVVAGTLAEAGMLPELGPINVMSALQIGVLALVALILGLFVIRPMLVNPSREAAGLPAPLTPLALPGSNSDFGNDRVLTGEIDDGGEMPTLSVVSDFDAIAEPSDPASRLRRLIEERQAESVEILRGWMEQQEERV
ncbi:MAG: flagellar basal-body MS-ring/collar protein FliF [Paracoccaceae bacterium]